MTENAYLWNCSNLPGSTCNCQQWQRCNFRVNVAAAIVVQGASIPAVRPGRKTAEYITDTLMYMSVLGSVFLGLLAVRPLRTCCAHLKLTQFKHRQDADLHVGARLHNLGLLAVRPLIPCVSVGSDYSLLTHLGLVRWMRLFGVPVAAAPSCSVVRIWC